MKEEFITLETAKLLNATLPYRDHYRPSQSLVQKWLRETKNLETLAVMAMIYAKLTMALI